MGRGHLSEPDGGRIIQDGEHDGFKVATRIAVVKSQLDPARAFMTLKALEALQTQPRA